MKWSQNVGTMTLRVYKVDAASSDEYCTTGPQPAYHHRCSDIDFLHPSENRRPPRGNGGLDGGSAIKITNLNSANTVSYMVLSTKRRVRGVSDRDIRAAQLAAQSVITVTGHSQTRKISVGKKYEIEYSLRGALLYGEWTTISEIFTSSEDELRSTLIVQLAAWSNLEVTELQAMSNA